MGVWARGGGWVGGKGDMGSAVGSLGWAGLQDVVQALPCRVGILRGLSRVGSRTRRARRHQRPLPRRQTPQPPRPLLAQAMADSMLEPPPFLLAEQYASALTTLGLALCWMPVLPISPFLAALGARQLGNWLGPCRADQRPVQTPSGRCCTVPGGFHLFAHALACQLGAKRSAGHAFPPPRPPFFHHPTPPPTRNPTPTHRLLPLAWAPPPQASSGRIGRTRS